MKIKGKVLNTNKETRQFVGKDGIKKEVEISYIVIDCGEIVEAKTYQPCDLPKVGLDVELNIRKYERNGLIGSVLF